MLLFVLLHCGFLLISKVTIAIPRNLQSRENLAERPRKASLMWITCQKAAVGTGGERGGEPASFHAGDAAHVASGPLEQTRSTDSPTRRVRNSSAMNSTTTLSLNMGQMMALSGPKVKTGNLGLPWPPWQECQIFPSLQITVIGYANPTYANTPRSRGLLYLRPSGPNVCSRNADQNQGLFSLLDTAGLRC